MEREWTIRVAGTRHRVALGKRPRAFWVDGVEHSLGGFFGLGPRTAAFDLAGREASMTLRLVAPYPRANLKRWFRKGVPRRLPHTLLAYIVGGVGVGAGAAAGSFVASTVFQWAIYELRVHGESRGSWVSTVTGDSGSWVFVEPGGALPERDWADWPAPRPGAAPQ